nr:hypothetical protein [Tanacetum cinerariifolium]
MAKSFFLLGHLTGTAALNLHSFAGLGDKLRELSQKLISAGGNLQLIAQQRGHSHAAPAHHYAAVAACTTGGFAQGFGGLPGDGFVAGYYQLGNALAVLHGKGLVGQVDQQHFNLAAIIGVDGAGAVYDANAVLVGQAAARAHLRLVAHRQGNVQARRTQCSRKALRRDATASATGRVEIAPSLSNSRCAG